VTINGDEITCQYIAYRSSSSKVIALCKESDIIHYFPCVVHTKARSRLHALAL